MGTMSDQELRLLALVAAHEKTLVVNMCLQGSPWIPKDEDIVKSAKVFYKFLKDGK